MWCSGVRPGGSDTILDGPTSPSFIFCGGRSVKRQSRVARYGGLCRQHAEQRADAGDDALAGLGYAFEHATLPIGKQELIDLTEAIRTRLDPGI